jgi:hypothetical protein
MSRRMTNASPEEETHACAAHSPAACGPKNGTTHPVRASPRPRSRPARNRVQPLGMSLPRLWSLRSHRSETQAWSHRPSRQPPWDEKGTTMGSPIRSVVRLSRRLLIAALLAAAATLGGSSLVSPATACGQTQQWDEAGYNQCAQGYEAQKEDDYVSWYQGVKSCCISFGGVWHDQQPGQAARCDAPPPRPTVDRVPPGGVLEQATPATPPPPRWQPPVGNQTLAPASPG